jgi:hypothetical protein
MTYLKNQLIDLAAYVLGAVVVIGLFLAAIETCVRGACV